MDSSVLAPPNCRQPYTRRPSNIPGATQLPQGVSSGRPRNPACPSLPLPGRLVNARGRRGRPRRAVASTAVACGAQVVECWAGGCCTIRRSAISRETRPSLACRACSWSSREHARRHCMGASS
jgi:hypothetical protein